MKTRYKSPTLVSMWMLDVFCCALGCVILLWVLESLGSTEQAKRAKSATADLAQTRIHLASTRDELSATETKLNATIAELKTQLAGTTADLTKTRLALDATKSELKTTETALATANSELASAKKNLIETTGDLTAAKNLLTNTEAKVASLNTELQKKQKSLGEKTAQLQTSTDAETALQKLLAERKADYDTLASAKKKTDDQLNDLDAKYRALEKDAKETTAALALSKKAEGELAVARSTVKDLQKKLDDSNVTIIDLQGDKKKLADKVDQIRIESENKFAGISMTGKNVCFVVDISGSMKLVDEKTPDPNKWPIVVETVSKVMRTIPDLDKFQVIIFSSGAKYVFGEGEWLDFKGAASLKKVTDALKAIEPNGDTNLYKAFDLAFRLRPKGLDTIYLFSDGLPTSGPGLTPEQERTLNGTQQTDLLSKHLLSTLKGWNISRESKRVRINSIGFFYESPEVGAFLWALSRENDGSFVGMSRP